jgi:ATP-binding cassette subfamily B (MDR/TAP) protein 1
MAHVAGVAFGYAFFIRFVYLGVSFYIASHIIVHQNLPPKDNFIAVFVLLMSALGAGINASNVPSVAKAKDAAMSIFGIIEEKPKIDVKNSKGVVELK